MHEEGAFAEAKKHDRAESARFAAAWPRHALLDHAAAQVRVHKTTFGVDHRLNQRFVAETRFPGEPGEWPILEYPHGAAPNAPDLYTT